MKYFILLLVFLLSLVQSAMSQQSDSLANASFSQAQAAYADGQYKEALDNIKFAEIAQGGATSKSLYLRIKALDQISNKDKTYLTDLQSALNTFFELTDKSRYPANKYEEMAAIKTAKGNLVVNESPAIKKDSAKYNKEEEQSDYDKALKAKTMEGYKEFLDKYSFTPHTTEIQKKYDDMVDDQNRDHEHNKAVRKKDRKQNREQYILDKYYNF